MGAAALERKNAGFTAIKMNATEELQMIDTYDKVDAVLERVAAIRESCGKYFGIAIDFHGRVHKPMAKVLAKKLEEFDPMFIEEPVLCENMEVFKEIAAACNVPIATGERLFTKYDFKRLLQAGGVDIIQKNITTTMKKHIIALAGLLAGAMMVTSCSQARLDDVEQLGAIEVDKTYAEADDATAQQLIANVYVTVKYLMMGDWGVHYIATTSAKTAECWPGGSGPNDGTDYHRMSAMIDDSENNAYKVRH